MINLDDSGVVMVEVPAGGVDLQSYSSCFYTISCLNAIVQPYTLPLPFHCLFIAFALPHS
jgi:hypothetical protein